MLVVSGPNAGGKTVGPEDRGTVVAHGAVRAFPIPVGPGTRIPVFRGDPHRDRRRAGDPRGPLDVLLLHGDAAEILEEAGPDRLALIDEIGGATDPEEGSAIAVAFLEEYLARGGRAIVTTHLSAVKTFAAGRSDAVCAAMEFDDETGRPNYRLHPGLSGRSRALSVARAAGPARDGPRPRPRDPRRGWERREGRETEAEAALERLRTAERELAREVETARREAERLAKERKAAAAERERMLEKGLAGFERARQDLARTASKRSSHAIRAGLGRRAAVSADAILSTAEDEAAAGTGHAEAREERERRSQELAVGDRARMRGSKVDGRVASLDGEFAWLEAGGKRMQVPRTGLERIEGVDSLRRFAPGVAPRRWKGERDRHRRVDPRDQRHRARGWRRRSERSRRRWTTLSSRERRGSGSSTGTAPAACATD